MSEIEFTSMIFPVNHRTIGRLTNLKQTLHQMRTNVDSFSLLMFLNGGREGATLTRTAPIKMIPFPNGVLMHLSHDPISS